MPDDKPKFEHHGVALVACLNCGSGLAVASGFGTPEPGDTTICFECGHLMSFDDQLKLRQMTDQEMIAIAGNPTLVRFQRARALAKAERDKERSKPGKK